MVWFSDSAVSFGGMYLWLTALKVLKFFTYVVPLALFLYYPFLYLIGRTNNEVYMLLPLAGILFLIPCLMFWKIGIRHYKSTGS